MASLMDNLLEVLEKENSEYEQLVVLSKEKRQIIIDGKVAALDEVSSKEQDVLNNIKALEGKREEIAGDMAIVLGKESEELTLANLAVFLNKQPEEQKRLEEVRERLIVTLTEMGEINVQNEALLNQAKEMVEFDLELFKSMRQAPTTANYNKQASNTGDILPNSGAFDAKQ